MVLGSYKCNAEESDEMTTHVFRNYIVFTVDSDEENSSVYLSHDQVKELIKDLQEVVK